MTLIIKTQTRAPQVGRLQIDSFFLAIRVEFAEFAISYLKMRFFPLMDIIITIHAFD